MDCNKISFCWHFVIDSRTDKTKPGGLNFDLSNKYVFNSGPRKFIVMDKNPSKDYDENYIDILDSTSPSI